MSLFCPVAFDYCVKDVFNKKHQDNDGLFMFPLDIRKQKNLLHRFAEGHLVSCTILNDSHVQIANDGLVENLGASMCLIKSLTFKKFSNLTEQEAERLESVNSGFYTKWKNGEICIKKDATISLIRFNRSHPLLFSQPGQGVPMVKVVH